MVSLFIFWLYAIHAAYAVGSGGILNLIPQARVRVEQNGSTHTAGDFRVYVHPMEGSIVLFSPGAQVVLALDKNKKQAIEFKLSDIIVSKDGTFIDVPERTSFKVLPYVPHFNRTHVSLVRDDGSRLIVDVPR